MTKIKVIARENAVDNKINITIEPCIKNGTRKEQEMGLALVMKISQMLKEWEDELILEGKKEDVHFL